MQPRKLNVAFVFFSYGGNGGTASEVPDIRNWFAETLVKVHADPRVGAVSRLSLSDTPITMTRCKSVKECQKLGVDVMLMIDSDQFPDMYLKQDPDAKPFWDEAFTFLYNHWEKGPICLVAPYCGPPGHPVNGGYENVYVFRWENFHTDHLEDQFKLEPFGRHEASLMTGISTVDAGPTGLCMIDMRLFDYIPKPYFDYDWEGDGPNCEHCGQPEPGERAEKASTEDCRFFRNIALNVVDKLGYNPVFCCWDSWAGHWKPWCVGKPTPMTSERVNHVIKDAMVRGPKKPGVKLMKVEPQSDRMKALLATAIETRMSSIPPMNASSEFHSGNGAVRQEWKENAKSLIGKVPLVEIIERFADKDMPLIEVIKSIQPSELGADPNSAPQPQGLFDQFGHGSPLEYGLLGLYAGWAARDAKRAGRKMVAVELGSWVGHSALAICKGIEEMFSEYTLHCVDNWQGESTAQKTFAGQMDIRSRFFETVGNRATDLGGNRILAWSMQTDAAAKCWSHGDIDLIYIDADHSYKGCLADIEAWLPHVREGGFIVGHDYSSHFPGVKQAVHEVFGWGADIVVSGSVWCVRKGKCDADADEETNRGQEETCQEAVNGDAS